MKLVPALVLGLVALAGCTGGGDDVESQEANTNTTHTTTTTTASSTSTTTASSATSTSTSSGSGTRTSSSSAASTVHTDGGDVTVRATDGRLEVVEVETAPGWRVDQQQDGPDRLVVTFERDGGLVEVTVELTPTGVVTHTRSESTG
jgi:hypothetical protein